jgi:hypothetical protein
MEIELIGVFLIGVGILGLDYWLRSRQKHP